MKINQKILIWTWTSPFSPSGSPQILRKLCSFFPDNNILIVSGRSEANPVVFNPYIKVIDYSWVNKIPAFSNPLLNIIVLFAVKLPLLVVIGIYRIVIFKPDIIMTIFFAPEWILSASVLSRLTRKPLFFYCHDPFFEKYKYRPKIWRRTAAFIERFAMRSGKAIALYESLKNHYEKKYGNHVTVLPHMVNQIRYLKQENRDSQEIKTIGFAGSIYENNLDSVIQLLTVTRQMPKVKLVFWGQYSEQTLQLIAARQHPNFEIRFATDHSILLQDLSQCDLLYLPLSGVDSLKMPRECLQLVLPTKALDYLQAGVPILVHCPKDYELSRFFIENQAAYTLHSDKLEDLAQMLDLWQNGMLPALKKNDLEKALHYFEEEKNSLILKKILALHD